MLFSFLLTSPHDSLIHGTLQATSEKVHAAIVSNLGKNDSKEELKLTKSVSTVPPI